MTDLVKENFKSHFVKGILARWTLLLEIGELLNYILDIDMIEVLIGQGNSILREFCKSYLRV